MKAGIKQIATPVSGYTEHVIQTSETFHVMLRLMPKTAQFHIHMAADKMAVKVPNLYQSS